MEFTTKLLHGTKQFADGATLPPIAQVSAFAYDSAEEMEQVFSHRKPGHLYSRISNPTVGAFEERMNQLEGGIGAVACASGMGVVTTALLNILQSGDEVIAGSGLFGGTIDLFGDLEAFGIRVRFVRHIIIEEIEPLVNEKTKAVFGELIGNPALDVVDLAAVSELAHRYGIPLIIDSTTATPYLCRPIEYGADIVVHSSSKYINGSGSAISGIIVDSGKFAWDKERYPALADYAQYGRLAFLAKLRNGIWRNMGNCLSPVNAFLNYIGIETLGLRMERICRNAFALVQELSEKTELDVNYPLLPDSPYHALVKRQLNGKGGGILTVRAGSKEKAFAFINHLQYACRVSNIGDARTLVIHPASTIYRTSNVAQREAAGVYEDTARISAGIEDTADLVGDFLAAAEAVG